MGEEDTSTKETMNTNRFSYWIALMAFSAIVLGAFRRLDSGEYFLKSGEENWVLAGTIIAMTFGFFAVCAHGFVADKFVGKFVECLVAVLCVAVWCALLPVIMKPENSVAVYASDLSVKNANIYFFSWGAFISAWLILARWTQEVKLANFQDASTHMVHWYIILAASVVVLWTSSNYYEDLDNALKLEGIDGCDKATGDTEPTEQTCNRTGFAVVVGAVGTLVALIFLILSRCGRCGGNWVMIITSFFLFGLYAFGVGFVTFDTGPAVKISNLYFAIWIGFTYCMFLFANALAKWWSDRNSGGVEEGEEEAAAADKSEVAQGKEEEGQDEKSEDEGAAAAAKAEEGESDPSPAEETA